MKQPLLSFVLLLTVGACSTPEEAFVRIEGPAEWEGAIVRMEAAETKLISLATGREQKVRSEKDLPLSPFPHEIIVFKDGFESVHFGPITPGEDERLRVLQMPPGRRPEPPEYDRLP